MSSIQTKKIIFKHANPCSAYKDCPGHYMHLDYRLTSDHVHIVIDGAVHHVFDENTWDAAVNLEMAFRTSCKLMKETEKEKEKPSGDPSL